MPTCLARGTRPWVQAIVTLTEGRFHQVKRMIAAVGGTVTQLHRQRIGGLTLPNDLKPGTWRVISQAELAALDEARPIDPADLDQT